MNEFYVFFIKFVFKFFFSQGILTLRNGKFVLENCGRRPFYINGQPLAYGNRATLLNNSVIEVFKFFKYLFSFLRFKFWNSRICLLRTESLKWTSNCFVNSLKQT